MSYTVVVLPEAENDSGNHADGLLDQIENKCSSLNNLPERGHSVPELKRVHVDSFREIHFKPYRILYQIVGNKVFIHAVLDGRRELQELLEKRILR